MNDLIEFLRARLDEDERVARAATPGPWRIERWDDRNPDALHIKGERGYIADNESGAVSPGPEDAEHIARHDPARVLREVEAKRRLVDEHAPTRMTAGYGCMYCGEHGACTTVRLLALPYADHPDYRQEWA